MTKYRNSISFLTCIVIQTRYTALSLQAVHMERPQRALSPPVLKTRKAVMSFWRCSPLSPTTVKAAYNGGGKSAPQFRNIEIIHYRYLLYKHPYMGPTKSTLPTIPYPPPLTSPSNPSASSPPYDALKASFHES
jgi:hypothetical protein